MERQISQQEQLLAYHPKTSFTVISGDRVVNIPFDEITHISKCGNGTIINTVTARHSTCLSIEEICNDLPVNDFFRIHRSYIASVRYMNGIKRTKVAVGMCFLPISRLYKLQLLAKLKIILNSEYASCFQRHQP